MHVLCLIELARGVVVVGALIERKVMERKFLLPVSFCAKQVKKAGQNAKEEVCFADGPLQRST